MNEQHPHKCCEDAIHELAFDDRFGWSMKEDPKATTITFCPFCGERLPLEMPSGRADK